MTAEIIDVDSIIATFKEYAEDDVIWYESAIEYNNDVLALCIKNNLIKINEGDIKAIDKWFNRYEFDLSEEMEKDYFISLDIKLKVVETIRGNNLFEQYIKDLDANIG